MNIEEAIHIINSSNCGKRIKPIKFDYIEMYIEETLVNGRWITPAGVYSNDIHVIELAKSLEKK